MRSRYVEKHHLAFVAMAIVVTLVASFFSEPSATVAQATPQVIFLTSGSSWTVPSDWNSSNNTIHAIGGGGGGAERTSSQHTAGGGGGEYRYITNFSATPGASVSYSIGAAGQSGQPATAGGNTTFNTSSLIARGGGGGDISTPGAGGSGGTGTGGNNGGSGGVTTANNAGSGGGGAGGPNGVGATGGTTGATAGAGGGGANGGATGGAGSGTIGGVGGNNRLGVGGGAIATAGASGGGGGGGSRKTGLIGGNGSTDAIWTATAGGTAGPGSGGGGGRDQGAGNGGSYGGGGGGAGSNGTSIGNGAQGIIVIVYTPITTPGSPGTPTFSSVTSSAMRVSWTASSNASATSYKVERCEGAGCSSFSEIATGVATLYYDDSSLAANTAYSYRIRGVNAFGNGTYSGTGTQATGATPPTCSLSVNPTSMMPGQSSTLSWTSTNATDGSIDTSVGAVSTSGSVSVSPLVTTTYTGTFTGAGGSIQCQTTLTIGSCSSAGDGGNMNGFAWSENIGWISFNSGDSGTCTPTTYGVSIDEDGELSGYAWSENIGWISANEAQLTGCPVAPCKAYMESSALRGWMKALAADGSGWDGWISLSGTSPAYGPTLNAGVFSGQAWASDVVGWIDFNAGVSLPVATEFTPCEASYQCTDSTHRDNLCTPTITENEYCGDGNICSLAGGLCTPPGDATGDLELNPSLVPTGNTTEVSWEVIDTTSCRVFGENGDEWYGSATEGPYTSSPILETTLYTLECTNALGNATSTVDTAYAVVVPTWVER